MTEKEEFAFLTYLFSVKGGEQKYLFFSFTDHFRVCKYSYKYLKGVNL